ncbi:MAG: heavy metal-responsive transcriptional regulator [Nitrospira sp.]|nr:heavy metal-responsive transcriptional regulator [Nitrospira sp.]
MGEHLTIGRLAKAVGVNIQTVRYYERLKLIEPIERKLSGYRLYDGASLKRLRFIKNAQTLGFTLHEIADLLNLRVSSKARCGDVQRRTEAKLVQVESKLRDLQALARSLRRLIRTCRSGQPTDRCPILQSLETKERRMDDDNRETTR